MIFLYFGRGFVVGFLNGSCLLSFYQYLIDELGLSFDRVLVGKLYFNKILFLQLVYLVVKSVVIDRF